MAVEMAAGGEADPLVPADGTYAEGLPDVGVFFKPDAGLRKHLARTWRGGWLLSTRTVDSGEVDEIAFHQRSSTAASEFQRARRELCQPGQVVEAYRAKVGGWQLVDRGPRLSEQSVANGDGEWVEYVWGQDGTRIGVTRPHKPGQWMLLVPDRADDGGDVSFQAPGRFRDYEHASRVDAIRAAERLAPQSRVADDDWVRHWSAPVTRFREAGVAASFEITIDFLGPTGTICAAPGCPHEALVRLVATGSDVGNSVRLACNRHGGEVLARQSIAAEGHPQD